MFSGLSFFDKHIKIRYLLRVIQQGNMKFVGVNAGQG